MKRFLYFLKRRLRSRTAPFILLSGHRIIEHPRLPPARREGARHRLRLAGRVPLISSARAYDHMSARRARRPIQRKPIRHNPIRHNPIRRSSIWHSSIRHSPIWRRRAGPLDQHALFLYLKHRITSPRQIQRTR